MNSLQQSLSRILADQLSIAAEYPEVWHWYCDKNQALFEKVCAVKPDISAEQHLLGIATKQHMESLSQLQATQAATSSMNQIIQDTVGKEHAERFKSSELLEFTTSTHIWLYIQGYLGMDFSLANDYVQQSAEALSSITLLPIQELRTNWLASYYLGLSHHKSKSKTGLLEKLRRLWGK